MIPVMRPLLPNADELLPYLRRIDEARWYSNHGPLLREFDKTLAAHFGVAVDQISVVANGTVALSAALVALGAKPGAKVLLPSWTFVASASAVWAANMQPHFVDVSPTTWMLEPAELLNRNDLHEVGAVMAVSAFGSPVDVKAWDAFTERTRIPVLIDGAASFDSAASVAHNAAGKSPIMISLHATKVFGVGEGGLVLSTDRDFIRRFNQVCNFGVWDSPAGQILGYNGKLNEYNAAVGLAMYEKWPQRRAQVEALTRTYLSRLRTANGTFTVLPGYGDGWVACYCNIATAQPAAPIIEKLHAAGIETRRWWKSGVHVQEAYQHFARDPLPNTEHLASRTFGLPFFHDITESEVTTVVSALDAALA